MLLGPGLAVAADLLQVYRDALSYDAQYAAARAQLDAGREKLPQGRAGLLPTVVLNANTQWNDYDFKQPFPGPRKYNSNGYSVQLTQPLFHWQNWIQYDQGKLQAAQAETQFATATQDLILRVAQAYFDVLLAEDSLGVVGAQKTAISEQLEQAKRNFEVGTATIVDTHEAQARYDLVVAQEIAAANDLEVKRQALRQIIGKVPDSLLPLRDKVAIRPPEPKDLDQWVSAAEKDAFSVQVQQAALDIASREVDRNRAGHYPTLDLVASRNYVKQGATVTSATPSATEYDSTVLGVQLAVPLYQGGLVTSRTREAAALREKALQDLESTRRASAQNARQAYLGVTSGLAQVSALEQALVSSQSALDSNKLGYEVGVRINIDVLNAQQQLYSTRRDLSKARYDTLLAQLRLKAAAGTLGEADLVAVNGLLGAPGAEAATAPAVSPTSSPSDAGKRSASPAPKDPAPRQGVPQRAPTAPR
ncbi:MAG: TolC family outer membrane protein [Rhodocyclaceae bacterium]